MSKITNPLIAEYIDSWTQKHLRNQMKASDEELVYYAQMLELRHEKIKLMKDDDVDDPSVVIDDFLYHGDISHASNVNILRKLGIQNILNACDLPLDTEITKNYNVLWINIVDDFDININQYFQQTNEFLFSCSQKNSKVLVHCQMGVSRSSAIVLAYLMK